MGGWVGGWMGGWVWCACEGCLSLLAMEGCVLIFSSNSHTHGWSCFLKLSSIYTWTSYRSTMNRFVSSPVPRLSGNEASL